MVSTGWAPKVLMGSPVAVSIALRLNTFDAVTIPAGRAAALSRTETAAPPAKVPGAKLTVAPPPALPAVPPADVTTVGGVRVAVTVRLLGTAKLGSRETIW